MSLLKFVCKNFRKVIPRFSQYVFNENLVIFAFAKFWIQYIFAKLDTRKFRENLSFAKIGYTRILAKILVQVARRDNLFLGVQSTSLFRIATK
jgi:hypothetical protein